MKKKLFLLACLLSLQAFSQSYNSHVFYSSSKALGTFNKEMVENIPCEETFDFQDLIGRFYVNIQDSTPLEPNKFYFLDFGQGFNYYYLTSSRVGEHSDEDYRLSLPHSITQISCRSTPLPKQIKSFKVNQAYYKNFSRNTTFEYEYEIQGDYRGKNNSGNNDITISIYYNSINQSNLITKTVWEMDEEFFPILTKREPWGTSFIDYDTDPKRKFYLKFEYAGNSEILTYTVPKDTRDFDGDGVQNWQDNCPNQAGPSSNNGCPVGNPDFVIVSISIDAGGLTTNTNDDNSLTLRENQDHKFCVNIKNTGAVTGTINNTALILTNNSDLSKASIVSNLPYPKSSLTISPNQTGKMCSETHIRDTYLGNNLTNFYYLHAIADYDNNTSESNENNNQAYTSVNSSSSKTPTQLTIHDVNGNKVKDTTINNETEETDVIKSLPKGFYFINKDGKKSKIYKKN
ncbi:hypothetical protein HER15_10965 [Tenacibaculum mesophilum]|uniref:Por secretion system C-terminal sorting domain-containing protein n=3 Tax=Tenacibaculum TaxID=104267 RepID=A0AAE9SIX7_9FLAO|nr:MULTISPECIES: thrombospondin type 3 repeat-containing protein [Tenacibaculum]MCO7184463.1 thrombospondin type 3 repeat-containing protein [Tenacibaculum sp. XPcli2-G]UTD15961.1 hypothetical protein HER15_10965 [Tenacibaculum mesophilum]